MPDPPAAGPRFVDTNVFVYRHDDDEPAKQARAREVLEGEGAGSLVVSTQVLQEFYVVVTRKLTRPLDARAAADAVDELCALPVVGVDKRLVRTAIATSRRETLSLWDAMVIEAAVVAGCEEVLTEDLNDGQVISGVRVVDPFAA